MRIGPAASFAAIMWAGFVLMSTPAMADDEADTWSAVSNSQSAGDFAEFLNAFPRGAHANEARQKYSLISGEMLAPVIQSIQVRFPRDAANNALAVGPSRITKLDILVKKDGTAGTIKIVQRSGYDPFDSAAVGGARRATYLPAVDHGMPVDAYMPYEVNFRLLCAPEATGMLCDLGRFPRQ
jgi:TonB family protein